MKIKNLLDADSVLDAKCLSSLGDSYLLRYNSLYKKVRQICLDEKFEFKLNANSDFLALPLVFLDEMLESKSIPYFDNKNILNSLEKSYPQLIEWDEVYDSLKRNLVFHESAHAVVRSQVRRAFLKFDTKTTNDPQCRIITLFLEESFANACEYIAIKDVEQAPHKIFYEFNSYIYHIEDRSLINGLIQKYGFKIVFLYTWLNYFIANSKEQFLKDSEFNEIIKICSRFLPNQKAVGSPLFQSDDLKKLKVISKKAFQLNPRFREITTGLYLKTNKLEKYFSFRHENNFIFELQKNNHWISILDKTIDLLNFD